MKNPPIQAPTSTENVVNPQTSIISSTGNTETPIQKPIESSQTGVSSATGINIAEVSKLPQDEQKRKDIYLEWWAIKKLSDADVLEKYPTKQEMNFKQKGDYIQKIKTDGYNAVYKKYTITEEDFAQVLIEAETKKWEWSVSALMAKQKIVEAYVEDKKIDLWVFCKLLVKDRLKSPKSAEFPRTDYTVRAIGGDDILVSSYVDAENTYGANIRSNFKCIIDYNNADPVSKKVEIQ